MKINQGSVHRVEVEHSGVCDHGGEPVGVMENTGATSLLYWQYLCKIEHKYFDFVGANIPAVAFFKRGFGGDLTPYYVSEGYKSKWIKRALSARRALRR